MIFFDKIGNMLSERKLQPGDRMHPPNLKNRERPDFPGEMDEHKNTRGFRVNRTVVA
jgi:hypothetical protein